MKYNLFDNSKNDQVTFGILDNNSDYLIGTRSSKIIKITKTGAIQKDDPAFSGLSIYSVQRLACTPLINFFWSADKTSGTGVCIILNIAWEKLSDDFKLNALWGGKFRHKKRRIKSAV